MSTAMSLQIFTSHHQRDEKIGDYCDSTLFKTHPLFMHDESALQIALFYDDIEVCNPLGSKAKVHKLGKENSS